MKEYRDLRLIPDWPRIGQLVAKHLEVTQDKVQAMQDSRNSLDKVELLMAMEEVEVDVHVE